MTHKVPDRPQLVASLTCLTETAYGSGTSSYGVAFAREKPSQANRCLLRFLRAVDTGQQAIVDFNLAIDLNSAFSLLSRSSAEWTFAQINTVDRVAGHPDSIRRFRDFQDSLVAPQRAEGCLKRAQACQIKGDSIPYGLTVLS
eukprot:scaffold1558_cov403-Prasinococcus_capsulatus_cf.AAC.33